MIWKNRKQCVKRIATIFLNVLPPEFAKAGAPIEYAIDKAIHKKDGDVYRYCDLPSTITDRQIVNLKIDAEIQIATLIRVQQLQHKAFAKAHGVKV